MWLIILIACSRSVISLHIFEYISDGCSQIKASVALIWLPASPPHHCERWNHLTVKIPAREICTKTEAAWAHAAPSLMLMWVWNIRHVFFFLNWAPPQSCTSRIQRGPSVVAHTRWPWNGSPALPPVATTRCSFMAGARLPELGCHKELELDEGPWGSLPLLEWPQHVLRQDTESKNQGKQSKWQEQTRLVTRILCSFYMCVEGIADFSTLSLPRLVAIIFSYLTPPVLTNKKPQKKKIKISAFICKSWKVLCLSPRTQSCVKSAEFYLNFWCITSFSDC